MPLSSHSCWNWVPFPVLLDDMATTNFAQSSLPISHNLRSLKSANPKYKFTPCTPCSLFVIILRWQLHETNQSMYKNSCHTHAAFRYHDPILGADVCTVPHTYKSSIKQESYPPNETRINKSLDTIKTLKKTSQFCARMMQHECEPWQLLAQKN